MSDLIFRFFTLQSSECFDVFLSNLFYGRHIFPKSFAYIFILLPDSCVCWCTMLRYFNWNSVHKNHHFYESVYRAWVRWYFSYTHLTLLWLVVCCCWLFPIRLCGLCINSNNFLIVSFEIHATVWRRETRHMMKSRMIQTRKWAYKTHKAQLRCNLLQRNANIFKVFESVCVFILK